MKHLLIPAIACSMLLASDGNTDQAQAPARVQVVAPVKVRHLSDINFGTIVLDDYNRSATVRMYFKGGWLADYTATPATDLDFQGCARYRSSAPHTPGLFQIERDALIAPAFFGYLSNVRTTIDQSVILRGGHGGNVEMVVNTDLPAEDFVPANPVPGVLYSKFQVAGTLFIPAKALGLKEGTLNVSVAYM